MVSLIFSFVALTFIVMAIVIIVYCIYEQRRYVQLNNKRIVNAYTDSLSDANTSLIENQLEEEKFTDSFLEKWDEINSKGK